VARKSFQATVRALFAIARSRGLLSVGGFACLCAGLFTIGLLWGLLGSGASLLLIDFMRDDKPELPESEHTPTARWHE
jgi:hypothetical protein